MNMKLKDLVIAVDFDGTCVAHEYPKIGRAIGSIGVLSRLTDEGAKLILWTMRSGAELQAAVDWFDQNKIPLWGIQSNPTQKNWTSSPKAYANIYIDDAAFGCPLVKGIGKERDYVDWGAVEKYFFGEK